MSAMRRSIPERMYSWWDRSAWGWLVILGPMLCYGIMFIAFDLFGLGPSNKTLAEFTDPAAVFRSGTDLMMRDIAGRLEYTIASVLFLLIALFSIMWSLPKILIHFKNPFGGVLGVLLSIGLSIWLYLDYINAEYAVRMVFMEHILELGEEEFLLKDVLIQWPPTVENPLIDSTLPPSELLSIARNVVYAFGNAAPWCLIVVAAMCASFGRSEYESETPDALRRRLNMLLFAVILAAANIVISLAFLRAMSQWPTGLFVKDVAESYQIASSRYTALWGALGSVLLLSALAPAYISLDRRFDRAADRALGTSYGRVCNHAQRLEWRRRHGLYISVSQAVTTGVAVVAPLLTSPTLNASQARDDPRPPSFEQRLTSPGAVRAR